VKFLFVLLAIPMIAHAAPSDPGMAAIDFLEKVRSRKLNLEPGGDTALSPQTAAEKKRQISRRLDRMARDLGSDPLEVGAVKLDEDFAAVLVRKVGGLDPSRLQVFPVAMVKRGAEWTAAPVPASFENAGTGHVIMLRKRLELLENWMLHEQVVDLEKLRAQSAELMRRKIETGLTARELRSLNAEQVGERFLTACERKDLPCVLGLLGGLAAKWPDDWSTRLKAANLALGSGENPVYPWRLLTAPEVIRMLVHHEEQGNHGSLVITCLDPAGNGNGPSSHRLEAIPFQLTKSSDGLWQINLVDDFMQAPKEAAENPDDSQDTDFLDLLPVKWTKSYPPVPQPTAMLTWQALLTALRNEKPQSILAISKIDIAPATGRQAFIQAVQTWWALHDPAALRQALPLAFHEDGTAAVGMAQFFHVRDPERLDARVFHFEKSAAGWLWTPNPSSGVLAKFQGWVDAEKVRWQGKWQQAVLAECVTLNKIGDLPAPSKEDARKHVEAWLQAIRQGDFHAALPFIARLGEPSIVLQNLGYEITGSRQSGNAEITGVYQGKSWTAVSVKSARGGKPVYPFYPVVQTPRGPAILLETDLVAAGNRGREFLNKAAFERLGKSASADEVDELRTLFKTYQADVENQTRKTSP
jgi:hypothetical protein